MTTSLSSLPSWFDYQDYYGDVALRLAAGRDCVTAVEIGGFTGESSHYLAELFEGLKVQLQLYVVDPWMTEFLPEELKGRVLGDDVWEQFKHHNRNFIGKSIYPIKNTSLNASSMFDPESLDFVFIDGDHSYAMVKEDIENLHPALKSHGIMAGHDYDWGEVHLAVQQSIGQDRKITKHGRCWEVTKST